MANVLDIFQSQMQGIEPFDIHVLDVANWLVSRAVLIPYRGARVAFFHQSATEYLAACEFARRYQLDSYTLKEKLNLTRWDQALFLTLSLLPSDTGAEFLRTVVDADLALALNAAKYIEFDRAETVAKLLSEIPSRITGFGPLEFQIPESGAFRRVKALRRPC